VFIHDEQTHAQSERMQEHKNRVNIGHDMRLMTEGM
jgi:hypothetical protein